MRTYSRITFGLASIIHIILLVYICHLEGLTEGKLGTILIFSIALVIMLAGIILRFTLEKKHPKAAATITFIVFFGFGIPSAALLWKAAYDEDVPEEFRKEREKTVEDLIRDASNLGNQYKEGKINSKDYYQELLPIQEKLNERCKDFKDSLASLEVCHSKGTIKELKYFEKKEYYEDSISKMEKILNLKMDKNGNIITIAD